MMKYMLMICRDEPVWERLRPEERQQIYRETVTLSQELTARGQYLGGLPLCASSSATSVRVRGGKSIITDGPFAETREQLGGYMIIDVDNPDGPTGTHQWYDGTPHPWEFARVWHLEPSPTDADTVYAGVEYAALFRTTDGGQTWHELPGLRTHESGHLWQPGAGGMCLHTIVLDPD